jgi:hypothetical protein
MLQQSRYKWNVKQMIIDLIKDLHSPDQLKIYLHLSRGWVTTDSPTSGDLLRFYALAYRDSSRPKQAIAVFTATQTLRAILKKNQGTHSINNVGTLAWVGV